MNRLPFKQRKFLANYILLNGNGVKAVYAAGYQQGYFAAGVTAHRLLKKAKIVAEIEKHFQKSKMSADGVIQELSEVAQVQTPIDANQKLKALELLGKFHKLFVDKIETTDTSERDGISQGLITSIEKAANRDNLSKNQAAIQLFDSLSDLPGMSNPANWGEYSQIITEHLESQKNVEQISEIQGEQ